MERGEEIIRNKDVPARLLAHSLPHSHTRSLTHSGLMRGTCGEDHQEASLERLGGRKRRGDRGGGGGWLEEEAEINLRQRSNSIFLDKDLLSPHLSFSSV